MINVVVISSDEAIQKSLAEQDDIQLSLVSVTTLDKMVRSVEKHSTDIVIMDQNMENIDIDIFCHFLRESCPLVQSLVLVEQSPSFEMLQNSGFTVRGYITSEQKSLITKAVRVVHDGEAWLPRKLVADMLNHFSAQTLNSFDNPKSTLRLIK